MPRIVRSTATTSWIDERLFSPALPEVDHGSTATYVTGTSVDRDLIVGCEAYRFSNLLEAYIETDPSGGITGSGFTEDSDLYRSPSFLGIESEPFEIRRTKTPGSADVTFRQLVGCRTKSPEVIGRGVGAGAGLVIGGLPGAIIGYLAGGEAAEELTAFPPIWTELSLTIRADGTVDSGLVRHSRFPSMCFFVQDPAGSQTYRREDWYDARSHLEFWKENGWGPYRASSRVGNPWGIPSPSGMGDNRDEIREHHSSRGAGSRTGAVQGIHAIRGGETRGGTADRGPAGYC